MTSFNKVILLGNLTRDPEVRYTPGDAKAVASFGLAVNEKYRSGDQLKETVSYIDIVVWGKSAENCGKYLFKGDAALIEGKFRQRRWDDKETGAKRSKLEVVAQTVTFMPKGGARGTKDEGTRDEGADKVREAFPDAQAVDEGEIPF